MEDRRRVLDRIYVQQYIYLLTMLENKEVTADEFESLFLHIRREDTHLMTGQFDDTIERILGTLFLDVNDYAPAHLFDPTDKFDISAVDLEGRARKALMLLNAYISKAGV